MGRSPSQKAVRISSAASLRVFEEFGLVPEGFHLGARNFGEGGALGAGEFFHFAEATGEFCGGFFECDFGIDVEETGKIDEDEEEVAEFGFDLGGVAGFLRG